MSGSGCATHTFTGPLDIPLAFGTWALGGTDWGPITAGEAKEVIRCAWDLGFRHYDTAESYGGGRAEQLLGQALRREIRQERDSLYLATKSVVREPDALAKHLERSLRRLGTPRIDLYYIHWPRRGISLLKAVEELERQRERGRIGAIGLSNISADEYHQVCARFPVAAVQAGYSFLWRAPEEDLWPALRITGGKTCRVAYSPLAQGLLARAFPREPRWDARDHRKETPLFSPPAWNMLHRFNDRYVALCRGAGLSPASVALRWLLAPGRADAAIVGGRTAEQLRSLVAGLAAINAGESKDAFQAVAAEIEELYEITKHAIPVLPNMFGYVPRPLPEHDGS